MIPETTTDDNNMLNEMDKNQRKSMKIRKIHGLFKLYL